MSKGGLIDPYVGLSTLGSSWACSLGRIWDLGDSLRS